MCVYIYKVGAPRELVNWPFQAQAFHSRLAVQTVRCFEAARMFTRTPRHTLQKTLAPQICHLYLFSADLVNKGALIITIQLWVIMYYKYKRNRPKWDLYLFRPL